MKKKPYRFFVYLLLVLVMGFVRLLPRQWALTFGKVVGRIAFAVVPRYRKRTLEHLQFAFGDIKNPGEIRRIGRQVFENLSQTAVDVILFPTLSRDRLASWVHGGDGYHRVDQLLQGGKGVIMITAHMGNWELLAGCFRVMGYSGSVVGRRIYYGRYDSIIVNLRRSLRVETIYRDSSPRKLLEVLKRNEILGLVTDQDVDNIDGIFIDFFSRRAYTTTAPAKLAFATGAPILPAFVIRRGTLYEMILEEPIYPNLLADKEQEVRRLTEAWSRVFENQIRRFPEQWVWMHNRWKTRPAAGSVEVYPVEAPEKQTIR